MPFPSGREISFPGSSNNNNNNNNSNNTPIVGGNSNLGILQHSLQGVSNRHPSMGDNSAPGGALLDSLDGGGDNEGSGHFARAAAAQPGNNPILAASGGSLSSSSNVQLQNPIGSSAKYSANSAAPGGSPGSSTTTTATTTVSQQEDEAKIYRWIMELMHGSSREQALLELGKKREQFEDLALILWNAYGVMATLLQEIIAVYPALNPPTLSAAASNRVCNALALLQCVASRNDTRNPFLNANIPLFLYPFLNTTSKTRPFEYLRLTSLGVIGALVKNDSSEVISFLLSTEIIPLCLRIMETGSELSKTVAIFIVQKILLDDVGLAYVCQTYERFYAVASVLSNMVEQLVDQQAVRLLKHVVRCYLRLSDNARARQALRQCLPEPLRDATFSHALRDDAATKRCLAQLLVNLSDSYE